MEEREEERERERERSDFLSCERLTREKESIPRYRTIKKKHNGRSQEVHRGFDVEEDCEGTVKGVTVVVTSAEPEMRKHTARHLTIYKKIIIGESKK